MVIDANFRTTAKSAPIGPLVAVAAAVVLILWALPEATKPVGLQRDALLVLTTLSAFVTAVTTCWLLAQASVARDGARALLGAFYGCATFATIVNAFALPGMFPSLAAALHATPQTALVTFAMRYATLAFGVFGYHLWRAFGSNPTLERASSPPVAGPIAWAIVIVWSAFGAFVLWSIAMPGIAHGAAYSSVERAIVMPATAALLLAAGTLPLLVRRSFDSRLELWLAAVCTTLGLGLLLVDASGALLTFGWYVARGITFATELAILAVLCFESIALERGLLRRAEQLEAEANHDHLTGLPNRRFYEDHARRALAQDRRLALPTAVAVIDIDRFKAYNDGFGHAAGDVCLRRVAATIAGGLWRPGDFVARLGGEEFVVVFAVTDAVGAMLVLERVRAALERAAIVTPAGRSVTVSAGVAQARLGENHAETLERADRALYRAKAAGRDRVECDERIDIESLFALPAHVA